MKRRERYGENMEERKARGGVYIAQAQKKKNPPFEVVIIFYSSGVGAEYLQCRQVWLYSRKIQKDFHEGKV